MKFKTRVSYPTIHKNAQKEFSHFEDQYEMVITCEENQIKKELVKSDTPLNIYERIQSDNHGLDVYDLLKRYGAGDSTAISFEEWQDGDFSAVTGSLLEMQQRVENAKGFFENSDLEIRKHYDNDLDKFLFAVDSGEFKQYYESRLPKENLEVNDNE